MIINRAYELVLTGNASGIINSATNPSFLASNLRYVCLISDGVKTKR